MKTVRHIHREKRRDVIRFVVLPLSPALVLLVAGWFTLREVDGANQQVLTAKLKGLVNSAIHTLDVTRDSAARELFLIAREATLDATGQHASPIPDVSGLSDRLVAAAKPHGFELLAIFNDSEIVWKNESQRPAGDSLAKLPHLPVEQSVDMVFWSSPQETTRSLQYSFLGLVRLGNTSNESSHVVAVFDLRDLPYFELLSETATELSASVTPFDSAGMPIAIGDTAEDGIKLEPITAGNRLVAEVIREPAATLGADPVYDLQGYKAGDTNRVAAAKWLEDYNVGVLCELDRAVAMGPALAARRAFYWLLGAASFAVMFGMVGYLSTYIRNRRLITNPNQRLGQYTLEEKIGEGAMGEVYRVSHSMLRRPTAIKLLRPAKSSAQEITRFEEEVQLTSQLTHPNTIAIYDYGRSEHGIFYYSMEYLSGFNFETVVNLDGPQSAGRVIHLLSQACGSLQEAHLAGLIHRDIKPANLFICMRGGVADIVKVLDFGLVKDLTSVKSGESAAGTPAYMAPEALLRPDSIDVRSDIYSLGAVGYFLLAGHILYEAETLNDLFKRLELKAREDLPFPVETSTDRELEKIIRACLAQSPGDRPSSAKELSAALQACPSAGRWTQEDAQHWWQSNKEIAAIAQSPNPFNPLDETMDIVPRRST